MDKLKATVDGIEKKIEYSEKFSKGILLVSDNKAVKRNCEVLKIDIGTATSELELLQKVTKLDKLAILTTRLLNQSFQYIIMQYAEREDFLDLLKQIPRQSQEALNTAYNLTKMKTAHDLDFFGRSLENTN